MNFMNEINTGDTAWILIATAYEGDIDMLAEGGAKVEVQATD